MRHGKVICSYTDIWLFLESPKCAISPYPCIRQINPRPAPSGTALCGIWRGMPAICARIVSGTGGMMAKAVSRVRADSLATRSNRQTQPREIFMECMTTYCYINGLNDPIFIFPLPQSGQWSLRLKARAAVLVC